MKTHIFVCLLLLYLPLSNQIKLAGSTIKQKLKKNFFFFSVSLSGHSYMQGNTLCMSRSYLSKVNNITGYNSSSTSVSPEPSRSGSLPPFKYSPVLPSAALSVSPYSPSGHVPISFSIVCISTPLGPPDLCVIDRKQASIFYKGG